MLGGIQAQHDSYIHYTRNDGLPSSNIYTCTEDRDGFMWFGTDNGLSRFDGQRFYNYSIDDGLTDNEVLQLVSDKQSGVWGLGLDHNIFYYNKGEIQTQFNQTEKTENISVIIQDQQSGIWAIPYYSATNRDGLKISHIFPSGLIQSYTIHTPVVVGARINNMIQEGELIHVMVRDSIFVIDTRSGEFKQRAKRELTPYSNLSETFNRFNSNYKNINYEILYYNESCDLAIWGKDSLTYSKLYKTRNFQSRINNASVYNDKLYLCFQDGGYCITDKYLTQTPAKTLNNIYAGFLFVDSNRNLWVCSSSGVYQLKENPIKIIDKKEGLYNEICHSVTTDEEETIYIGTNLGYIYRVKNNRKDSLSSNTVVQNERIMRISAVDQNNIWYATDKGVFRFSENQYSNLSHTKKDAVKNFIITKDRKSLYYSTHYCVKKIGTDTKNPTDTILVGKIFGLAEAPGGKIWMGGKKGLFSYDGNRAENITEKTHNEKLKNIQRLAFTSDSVLWICTNGEGLIAFKNDRILTVLKKTQGGITDNMCTALFVDSYDNVWLGTKKGLNKITHQINKGRFNTQVTQYGIPNGLSDDEIHDVFVRNTKVYIATSRGLNILDFAYEPEQSENQKVHVWEMKIENLNQVIKSEYIFPAYSRQFSVQYSRLCFQCSETPVFEYRILPEQSIWNTTMESSLNFQGLGYGNHRFEVRIKDKPESMTFFTIFIPTPWWKTGGFMGVVFLTLISGIIYLVQRLSQRKHLKETNERKLQQQIMELEMKAIRSQMSPHFIFNSLGAIQYYFNTGEKSLANTYMIKFAELIRSTLDISEQSVISLSEEIKYINTYLELEKLRFEELFDFYINIESGLDTSKINFPSLLLQPYIENAIKHGIQNNPEVKGTLIIRFYANQENMLVAEVEDNGIGMKKAKEINSMNRKTHESKGMDLSANRIKAMNNLENKKITLEIHDRTSESGEAEGTLIRITLPIDIRKPY
ncbi:MAG: histidine kinase [Bacteroidia bacterium]|nr:histidine kinase [Bacteroidia bacterium]